jgi:catechol-2,3-dioxygenase
MDISLNRVILFVQNVEELKNFYQKHFNFKLTEEAKDEWAVLLAGNCELALHKAGTSNTTADHSSTGNNNVKLVFETVTDLYQFRAKLIQGDVAMKEIKSFDNTPYLFCDGMDVEGNVFQLMQRVLY